MKPELLEQLELELARARSKYRPIANVYEGLGIATEQYHDLVRVFQTSPGEVVKQGTPWREFLELAVVCLRTLEDVQDWRLGVRP